MAGAAAQSINAWEHIRFVDEQYDRLQKSIEGQRE